MPTSNDRSSGMLVPVAVSARHAHLRHGDVVRVGIDSEGRDLVFGEVAVRVNPDFRLELHLDTDEANAAGVASGDSARLLIERRVH